MDVRRLFPFLTDIARYVRYLILTEKPSNFHFELNTLTIYLILDRSSNSEPDVKILIFYWSSSTLLKDVALTKRIVAKFHKTSI